MRFVLLALAILATATLSACRRGPSSPAPASTSGDVSESGEGIPSSVFGGGAPLQFTAEGTSAIRVHFGFERGSLEDPDHRYIERWKELPAGKHTFTIRIPAGTSGGVDVNLPQAKPGDRATCVVTSNGKELCHDYTLEEELTPGTAAFAQVNVDDWVTLEPESD